METLEIGIAMFSSHLSSYLHGIVEEVCFVDVGEVDSGESVVGFEPMEEPPRGISLVFEILPKRQ